MVSLMLSMCRLIFGTEKAVVLDRGFCVAKGVANVVITYRHTNTKTVT